ncbi:DUF3231 family protein [Metabacillus herbersteinensis]|uniref:DUF3231 family protein n=1 Tax=Metabacillus herbersteinensis TaxID=283816 RepID=A0ABV6G9W2_9BACI
MNDSMAKCILGFMLKHLEDTGIKPAVQFAYELSSGHLDQLRTIFQQEQYAIPDGFTENDVNICAERHMYGSKHHMCYFFIFH